MKVVILTPVPPEPGSSAAGARLMALIKAFRSWSWSVTLGTTGGESQFQVSEQELSALGITHHQVKPNNNGFDPWIKTQKPDLVIFDRFYIEEQFGWRVEQACPEALRVLETCDLHALREAREKHHFLTEPQQLQDLMSKSEKGLRELGSLFRSDLSLIISDYEYNLLRRQFQIPESLVHYLPFWVSRDPKRELPSFQNRRGLSWIGNFNHPPNWDSVRWMRETIWPQIRQLNPELTLSVYGAYESPKVQQLHRPEIGFFCRGRAKDAVAVLQESRVLLAPLRFGAGLKGKILDAAMGETPVVTTQIGAEGMGPLDNFPGLVGDSPEEIAQAAVLLALDPMTWQEFSGRSGSFLQTHFAPETHLKKLKSRLLSLRENLAEERRQNLIGKLLRHHFHQSTKHLSNWIQLKESYRGLELPRPSPETDF